VIPSGSKLWRFKYQLFGKENRFASGSYPETSLKVAREKAEAARKQVKQGLHPAREQQLVRLKSANEQTNTFEAIVQEWIARKDWEDITKKRRLDMLQLVVFATVGKMPLKAITPPIVLSILQKAAEKNGPTVMAEANRTMFGIVELATETFRVDVSPCIGGAKHRRKTRPSTRPPWKLRTSESCCAMSRGMAATTKRSAPLC